MKRKAKVLIADDNKEILTALRLFLSEHSYIVKTTSNPNLIPGMIREEEFDIFILDMNFSVGINSGNEGIFWLQEIKKLDKDAIVIFLTAYGDIDLAVRSLQKGATDFIEKPWNDKRLLATMSSALSLRLSRKEVGILKSRERHLNDSIHGKVREIIYNSAAMRKVIDTATKVAETDAAIMILGENGTGKDLLARYIHLHSGRSSEAFIPVDMGSLSDTLFESEVFGHVKGAFTDAKENKAGRFELASGGSLFLDEISNIPLHLQSKLLTVLQKGEVTRVGSNTTNEIDIRLITASNERPELLVKDRRFREDLLFRINTIQISIPALRDRVEDIEPLAIHFLKVLAQKYNKSELTLNSLALTKLKKYYFPGNIRELEHLIERAVILCNGSQILTEDIFSETHNLKQISTDTLDLGENETVLIKKALAVCKNNITAAAKTLGISRKTLYNKIEKYGI